MDEEYVLGLLLEIVRQSGTFLLEEHGEVAPYGVSIVGEHGEPASFFPGDESPGVPWPELFERVVTELRRRASEAPPFGVALVTGQAQGESLAFVAQIEIPACSLRAVFKYERIGEHWLLHEPTFDRELLVVDGICWPSQ